MKTLDEVLEMLAARIDRPMLERYIAREWVRPVLSQSGPIFEEIDIARVQLVCHLTQDIEVNDEGIDIALSLLDQLYGLRVRMSSLTYAVAQQPATVQADISVTIREWTAVED